MKYTKRRKLDSSNESFVSNILKNAVKSKKGLMAGLAPNRNYAHGTNGFYDFAPGKVSDDPDNVYQVQGESFKPPTTAEPKKLEGAYVVNARKANGNIHAKIVKRSSKEWELMDSIRFWHTMRNEGQVGAGYDKIAPELKLTWGSVLKPMLNVGAFIAGVASPHFPASKFASQALLGMNMLVDMDGGWSKMANELNISKHFSFDSIKGTLEYLNGLLVNTDPESPTGKIQAMLVAHIKDMFGDNLIDDVTKMKILKDAEKELHKMTDSSDAAQQADYMGTDSKLEALLHGILDVIVDPHTPTSMLRRMVEDIEGFRSMDKLGSLGLQPNRFVEDLNDAMEHPKPGASDGLSIGPSGFNPFVPRSGGNGFRIPSDEMIVPSGGLFKSIPLQDKPSAPQIQTGAKVQEGTSRAENLESEMTADVPADYLMPDPNPMQFTVPDEPSGSGSGAGAGTGQGTGTGMGDTPHRDADNIDPALRPWIDPPEAPIAEPSAARDELRKRETETGTEPSVKYNYPQQEGEFITVNPTPTKSGRRGDADDSTPELRSGGGSSYMSMSDRVAKWGVALGYRNTFKQPQPATTSVNLPAPTGQYKSTPVTTQPQSSGFARLPDVWADA